MKKIIPFFCLCLCIFNPLEAQNFNNGFNFALPPFDGTSQNFLPEFPAYTITEAHRVTTGNDGRFYSNGQPIRFWGVNMAIGANFPSTTDAAGVATRLRKMGVNLVRLHHLDNPSWGGPENTIFLDNNQGTRSLNPTTLQRLDYFIFQLKQNGIFVDVELNVSREFQESDGVIDANLMDPINKAEIMFDPVIRDLQKEFAQQYLTHVNPNTGLSLANDPVMAMLEMNNETSLIRYWKSDYLQDFNQGGLMLNRHEQMLDGLWNDWLVEKYGNNANLTNAWTPEPVNPNNLVENAYFEEVPLGLPWSVELHEDAEANIVLDDQNTYGGTYSCRLDVTQTSSAGWHIQFKNAGFSLEAGKTYELAFGARANNTYNIGGSMVRDNEPYNFYGGFDFTVTPAWQAFFFEFTIPEDNNGNGRIAISPDNQLGQFWFDNFSIFELPRTGLEASENLNNQNVQRILWSEKANYSKTRVADLTEFYMSVQQEHFDDLRSYLINTLNVQAPITGTNALGGPKDASTHENLDYLDDHAYWDHPQLLDDDFNSPNWLIRNDPMVRNESFSTIPILFGGHSFTNKPYTISEYNHCAPNIYRSEMMPFLVSYGLYHGLDAVMLFDYSANRDWTTDYVNRYFSLHQDHSIMGMSPSFAYAFRQGLVQENTSPLVLNYNKDWLYESSAADNSSSWASYSPLDRRLAFTHSIQVDNYDANTTTDFNSLPAITGSPYTTQTNETTLDTDLGLLRTATDRFITMGGFLDAAAPETAGDLTITQADGFGVVSWLSLTNNSLNNSPKSIITLSTRIQNSNMAWGNNNQTVNNNWGTAPTSIEPRQVTLRLNIDADYIRLYPLDEMGAEQTSTQIFPLFGNTFEVQLNQSTDQTLWWGVEAVGTVLAIDEALSLQAFAEKEKVRLEWQAPINNNLPFNVQKSIDGQIWENLMVVNLTNNKRFYQLFDKNPIKGLNYYRIQQKDADENLSFSNIAEVTFLGKNSSIKILPNPASTHIQIISDDLISLPLRWEITNLDGKTLREGLSQKSTWTIPSDDLAKGIYIIQFQDKTGRTEMKKVIIQ